MAKPIVVNLRGVETTFSFVKLERSKLYGRKRRDKIIEQNIKKGWELV
jgi:hypothetical protein